MTVGLRRDGRRDAVDDVDLFADPPGAPSAPPPPRWEAPVAEGVAALAALAVVVATRRRVAVTPDSITYVSAAQNLAEGHGYIDLTGHALTNFPPGYAAVLAAGDVVGLSPWTVGRYLGALVVAATVVLSYLLLRRHVRPTAYRIGATVLVASSTQLLVVGGAIASDALFVALTVAFVLVLDHLRTTRRRVGLVVVAAAVLVALAFLVKYTAAVLLVTGAVTVLVVSWRQGVRGAIARTVAFVGVAALVPALWLVRNARSDNPDVLGFRVASDASVPALVKGFVLGAVRVLIPERVPNSAALAALGLGVLVVVGVAWPLRTRVLAAARRDLGSLVPILVVLVGTAAFLLASERSVGADAMPRQFLPLWPLAVTVGAVLLSWIREADPVPAPHAAPHPAPHPDPDGGGAVVHDGRPVWRASAIAVLAGLVVVASTLWATRSVIEGVPTYYELGPEVVLGPAPDPALAISNDPWLVHLRTGRQPIELAPVAPVPGFSHRPLAIEDVLAVACDQLVVLVWVDRSPTTTATTPEAGLVDRHRLRLTELTRVDGATAYSVEPASPTDDC